MMLHQPPTTTLVEDLKDLKMLGMLGMTEAQALSTSPPQVKQPDAKGGDAVGPPGAIEPNEPGSERKGDAAAGRGIEIPVRKDTKKQGVAKMEDAVPAASAAAGGGEAATVDEAKAPHMGKKMPAWLAKASKAKEEQAAAQAQVEAEEAQSRLVEHAFQLVTAYHEADDHEGITIADLTAVVEAYSVIVDAYDASLAEAADELEMAAAKSKAAPAFGKAPPFGKKDDDEDKKDDDKDDDKDDKDDKDDEDKDDAKAESISPTLGRAARVLSESTSRNPRGLDALLADLRALTESTAPAAPVLSEEQQKLVEGYTSVRDAAYGYANQIIDAVGKEQNVAEGADVSIARDDPRGKLLEHIIQIGDDADKVLAAVAAGTYTGKNAEEDLGRLTQDLERALA